MTGLKLICVGKLKERFYRDACEEYQKRLGAFCKFELCELAEEAMRPDGLAREAERVLAAVPQGSFCIAMCIEGALMSSTDLADCLTEAKNRGVSRVCVIIGSSEGLHDSVKRRADLRLSMSPMTFPHHLARVMVLEQLYRACSIEAGTKYHK